MPTIMPSAPTMQVPIPEPPRVITTKDLSYLKDAMSWELIAFKKLHAFAQQATDPEVKQCLEKTGRMHQQHYQKLLTHLQNNNTAAMSAIPQVQSGQQQQQQQQMQ
ncbi:ferritin-like domain-containing protein [Brevibacillus brevis]|uniref:Ferritin-like domain-containing protein n=1 Tax=Brevibacillus brevis TaxID=1393 RepID=A0ABY9T3M5_BREBE|nr:ferritin-like domain-containing protein [Brevibacillus brevis]WNC14084.1 ferritin-like domain-containing protein [Brevibacillus brevis]